MPSKPPGSQWTGAQWDGISITGRHLLVSAAAGSGKTAVLAGRCAHLVCDADPPCEVDELLVVTFTEAAAAEMKNRIALALRGRIARGSTPRLQRQLALIDRAQVSTLHGFCSRLIRQNFHLLGLDPAFVVIDGDEATLLRTEVARELMAERHESPDAGAFQATVDAYGDGQDERLIKRIIHTHNLLCSLVDPEAWIEAARMRIDQAKIGDLRKSALGKALYEHIGSELDGLARMCESAIGIVKSIGGFDKYVADLKSSEQIVRHWKDVLNSDGIDALSGEVEIDFPRLSPVKGDPPGKKLAKGQVDLVRKELKEGSLRQILSFSTKQWQDGLKSLAPHAVVFLDLVQSFGTRYQAAKDAIRGVDFADLERLALAALRHPGVSQMMRKRYAHVLVDEYQDINEVQDTILSLLCRDNPGNLFCVGDVKQSIYRFRLAEPTRFLERQQRFRDANASSGQVIDLQSNFRSRAPLLDALNGVFERLMTRDAADIDYDQSHRLQPGLAFPDGDESSFTGAPIELHLLPAKIESDDEAPVGDADSEIEPDRAQREAQLIAQRIHQLMGRDGAKRRSVVDKVAGKLVNRLIEYKDIVILLRSMRHKGEQYAEVLRRSGIPVHSETGTGYFDSMEVNDLLSLLKVLDNRAQDIPLAAVLRSPIASLPQSEDALAQIRLAYPDRSVPFHQTVVKYATEKKDDLADSLRDILARLDRWHTLAQRRPLAELIWDVYNSTGYLAFCAGLREGEQRKANLIDLHDRARQFGSFQRQGLARFLAFLDQLREESDLGQPPVVSEGENVVRIMTIHHSKGLEFPVVIVPDLGKRFNLSDASGSILVDRHAYLGMDVVDEERQVRYPSLASTLVSNRIRRQSVAEEMRVLYVAMTRAKEHLICVGTCKDDAEEDWLARWKDHQGPLPAERMVKVGSMLDWVGPAAVAMRGAVSEPIQIIRHTADDIRGWSTPESMQPVESDRLKRLAALAPLSPQPATDKLATEIIARLDFVYEKTPLTKIPAVEAATRIAKPQAASPTHRDPPQQPTLHLPRSIDASTAPSAADVGQATHLLLQHLNFARSCDDADLKSQISKLVEKRLILPSEAGSVDFESIVWLIAGPVGQLLRKHAGVLRRELPLYLAIDPDEINPDAKSDDARDKVMIRSRLDVLIPTDAGLEIVDYKTDKVARPDLYKPQMRLYRRAVEGITGRSLSAVHLVFLSARRIETLSPIT